MTKRVVLRRQRHADSFVTVMQEMRWTRRTWDGDARVSGGGLQGGVGGDGAGAVEVAGGAGEQVLHAERQPDGIEAQQPVAAHDGYQVVGDGHTALPDAVRRRVPILEPKVVQPAPNVSDTSLELHEIAPCWHTLLHIWKLPQDHYAMQRMSPSV